MNDAKMTPDQLHLEVLKAMGWSRFEHDVPGDPHSDLIGQPPGVQFQEPLPPLTLDLMWQAWSTLNGKDKLAFSRNLRESVVNQSPSNLFSEEIWWLCENATAEQRARAFLKVKGIA